MDEPPPLQRTTRSNGKKPAKKKAKGRGDRFRVLNSFVDRTLRELRRNEIAVWLVLYRDVRDGVANTSQVDIALRAGLGKRTVVRVIRRLVDKRLVQIVRRGGINSGASTYRIEPLEPGG
jgi:hypothetical protein